MDAVANIKRQFIHELAAAGKRADGRGMLEYRDIKIVPNYLKKADGSAFVELGDTKVIVGVKYDVGTPFPDIPNEVVMTTSAELAPMASRTSSQVRQARTPSSSLAWWTAASGNRTPSTPPSSAIKPGELVRIVFVDIQILDQDGNLIDACGIAAITALLTAKMRVYDSEGNPTDTVEPLPVPRSPCLARSRRSPLPHDRPSGG
jgi:exosome complex component RRP42